MVFHNRFVSPREMASLVGSADIYVTPYRYEAQAVSGTLAYALGAGKAIIALARKFLGIIYRTLKNKWVFEDFPNFVLAERA